MPEADIITMFTDASWHRDTSIGVWAMWAKFNGDTIRYSGRLKAPMRQIGTAELAAIANGLYCIQQKFTPVVTPVIITQTDSLEAITAIQNNGHNREEDTNLVAHIKSFVAMNGWRLVLRHVKGHKGTSTRRNAVNTWCDKECHRRMKIALGDASNSQLVLSLTEAA